MPERAVHGRVAQRHDDHFFSIVLMGEALGRA